ncbi:MAG: winged helix-turn-helix transcriptional regulator [Planctomycetales bacterium]|nr:winged helix-turn-helix transcriptional regulator [Planctomycetales bacterium]
MEYRSVETETFNEAVDQIAVIREEEKKRDAEIDELASPMRPYMVRLVGRPIDLSLIEYRIFCFLSAKPYKPYTRRQIVDTISSPKAEVTTQTIDTHVRSLRDKLGIFSDFIQTVPYIGYRFKP